MVISSTAFGVYFYLMAEHHKSGLMLDIHSKASEVPHSDLSWLALASMAVFISGEMLKFCQK